MNKPVNVFILAAGLGERLRPITHHIPKPLIPVLGRPVIERVLDHVSVLPYRRIGINLHYRKETIQEWVLHCPLHHKIILFPEEHILGTGGALRNARDFLKEGTFLVHNSDILSEINVGALLHYHRSSQNLVTLAVHDYPKFNSLVIDEAGSLRGLGTGLKCDSAHAGLRGGHKWAFTGIAVYEPEFLKYLPEGKSSVVDAWLKAVATGEKIGAFDVRIDGDKPGPSWTDIGTPDTYAYAVFHELRRQGEMVFIHPSLKTCPDAYIQGNVVIEEGCDSGAVHAAALLRNCILLPGCDAGALQSTSLCEESLLENCIIGPGFRIDLIEKEIVPFFDEVKQLIGTGGSDRKYYRIKEGGASRVLMQCREDDPDYERHIEYTRFFQGHNVPVPQLLETDIDKMTALFEDAGDMSLCNWLKCPRETAEIEGIYRQALDIMVLLHSEVTDDVSACPLLASRLFDYEHFRWETDYFIKRYIEDTRNIRIGNRAALNEELDYLAVKADAVPKVVIHRDFQSQNIMVMRGQKLRLIDYQGARIGPPAYDVASLLWDPYYRLEDDTRDRLLGYYLDMLNVRSPGRSDDHIFGSSLVLCRLQRHMQALGAYGFLSLVKGKKYFQKYMPEGLRLLKDDALQIKEECPVLYGLITEL